MSVFEAIYLLTRSQILVSSLYLTKIITFFLPNWKNWIFQTQLFNQQTIFEVFVSGYCRIVCRILHVNRIHFFFSYLFFCCNMSSVSSTEKVSYGVRGGVAATSALLVFIASELQKFALNYVDGRWWLGAITHPHMYWATSCRPAIHHPRCLMITVRRS